MRNREGYIMIWRVIQDSAIWQNNRPEILKVALYLTMNARFSDGQWTTNSGDIIPLKKGQLVIGRKQAASDCRVSEQTLRTVLKFLQKTEFLTIKPTNKFSLVTICKYGTYQNGNIYTNQQANQQLTSTQPATNQQLTTKNNYKNEENGKNDKNNPLKGGYKATYKGYGELGKVKLTDEEYESLKAKHPLNSLNQAIEILDTYIASKGDKYKNHYAVFKKDSWVWERVSEKSGTNHSITRQTDIRKSRDMVLMDAVDALEAADKQGGDVGRCLQALGDKFRDYGKNRDGLTVAGEAYEVFKYRKKGAK